MKMWAVVVATWVCWTTVGPVLAKEPAVIDSVKFTTAGATKESYEQFMIALRGKLSSEVEMQGIPTLREPKKVLDSEQFLFVELSNSKEESVTFALNVTNMYLVGYRAGNLFSYFDDFKDLVKDLFKTSLRRKLPFESNYQSMERRSDSSRAKTILGIDQLDMAISKLNDISTKYNFVAKALLIFIQMVLEAARFRCIEGRVGVSIDEDNIHRSFAPDPNMLELENSWSTLSKAIQLSKDGLLSRPVILKTSDGEDLYVDNLNGPLKRAMGIMLFSCKGQKSDSCVYPEPTMHINGKNGLCIDVHDGLYNDGNPIILWPCKEQWDVSQLWTLKSDGTFQSDGKCMTTVGYTDGSNVVVFDCASAVTAATHWEMLDYGAIINPQSGLVLSPEKEQSVSGNKIVVMTNYNHTYQGWLVSNNLKPLVTSIVGFRYLCMEANKKTETAKLVECTSSKVEQKWAIYADGSMRLQYNTTLCLASNHQGSNVRFRSCSYTSVSRWTFRNDGTILNLFSNMVMEADARGQIIMWPFTGNPNQKWFPLL